MKRKMAERATATATTVAAECSTKIPRRKRAHISPVLCNFTASNASLKLNLSANSKCDEVSCNTTLESAVPPPNAAFHRDNEVIRKLQKKEVAQISVSEKSCVEPCSVVAVEAESKRNGVIPTLFSAVLQSPANTTTTVEQKTTKNSGDFVVGNISSDLACTENFSYDDYEVSSATNYSEIFSGYGESEFEDFTDEYTPSMWLNSGRQFSEKSGDDSTPSPRFSLFKEIYQQFLLMSSNSPDYEVSSLFDDQYSDELAYWRFECEEDEECYRRLRSRERNQEVKVKDYVEEYDFATNYGGLIVEQRLLMVNSIIELSRKKDLQNETMFLSVRLLDRFLSKGMFTSRKNLQLLGIACLTLAMRIEENQPYNSVRQKSFYVESNVYSRYEVVAMEWVVQEVLKFHCFSPTIYNFMWFYLKAATADGRMQRKAKYLAGLSLLDHNHQRYWPSTVAAALVILVSLVTSRDESSLRVMEAHVRTKVDDLPECIKLSRKKDLQNETMFLSVRLLDRFLSKGMFTSRKNLQLLGTACLTLAMRIEENQPYNSVRQKSFYVESNVYSRYEVVAMEWVVQEVLKFHCVSPTIYNFMWFYLKAAAAYERMQRKAKYLAGLSLLDRNHLRYWPSTVAAALVILVSLATCPSLRVMEVKLTYAQMLAQQLPGTSNSSTWQKLPTVTPQLPDAMGLRQPRVISNMPLPNQPVFVLCLTLPQTYDHCYGIGRESLVWDRGMHKFTLHHLRLLHETTLCSILLYDEQMDSTDLGSDLQYTSPTFSDAAVKHHRHHTWNKHGVMQPFFDQVDYFTNASILHKHYNMRELLDDVASSLGIGQQLEKGHPTKKELRGKSFKWWKAKAINVAKKLHNTIRKRPYLHCWYKDGDWFLYEIRLHFDVHLNLIDVPASDWKEGGFEDDHAIHF